MRVDITSTRKKYRVIYADPPWKFSSKEATGKSGGVKLPTINPSNGFIRLCPPKPLKGLDVGRIAHRTRRSLCGPRTPTSRTPSSFIGRGGSGYVTVAFVWSKKTVNGKTVSNLAPWTLKNCELCLMGTRGRMVQYKQRNNVPQLVEAVRTRHSEKPEEVRRSIEALFGDVPGSNSLPDAAPRLGLLGKRGVNHGSSNNAQRAEAPSIRTLWAIAKSPELGLTDEDLHGVVYRETGKGA